MPMKGELLVYVAVGILLGTQAPADDFRPKKVAREFPVIKNPRMVPAGKAGALVRDEELVLGVVVEKEARAYPINMLTNPTREIVNDTVGGRAIAATW